MAQEATAEEIADAVIALLSVGGFSLERAWACLEGLRTQGLLETSVVLGLDEGEVVRRLSSAGYDRGAQVTTMMGKRLTNMHNGNRRGAVRRACDLLREGKQSEAEHELCTINGVGPAVFRNFVQLRGGTKPSE